MEQIFPARKSNRKQRKNNNKISLSKNKKLTSTENLPQETMVAFMQPKKVASYGNISKLTLIEKEILGLVTEEFLDKRQIQIRKKCTRQAIEKHIRNLKMKGFLNIGLKLWVMGYPD